MAHDQSARGAQRLEPGGARRPLGGLPPLRRRRRERGARPHRGGGGGVLRRRGPEGDGAARAPRAAARLRAVPRAQHRDAEAGDRGGERRRVRGRLPARADVRPLRRGGARALRDHRGALGPRRAVGGAAPLAHPAARRARAAAHGGADRRPARVRDRAREPRRSGGQAPRDGASARAAHREQRAPVGARVEGDGLRLGGARLPGGARRGRPSVRAGLPERGRPGRSARVPREARAEVAGPLGVRREER